MIQLQRPVKLPSIGQQQGEIRQCQVEEEGIGAALAIKTEGLICMLPGARPIPQSQLCPAEAGEGGHRPGFFANRLEETIAELVCLNRLMILTLGQQGISKITVPECSLMGNAIF